MSYDEDYNRRGDYPDRREGYGEGRREPYGQRRDEGGYGQSDQFAEGGVGGYGEGRSEEYDEGRREHHGRRQEGYGGAGEYDDMRPGWGSYAGSDTYGDRRRPEGRHEMEPGYGDIRQELREHGSTGYGASRPGESGGYGAGRASGDYYGEGGGSRIDEDGRSGGYGGRPHNTYGGSAGGASFGPGGYGGGGYGGDDDYSSAAHEAQQHAGSSGDSALFGNALSMLSGNKQRLQNEDLDEQEAVRSHQALYGGGGPSGPADSSTMGSAAAMQALKMFTGGHGASQAGAGGQNQFIGMAMAQASKLFDQQSAQGNTHPNATKQDAIAQAAQMALKMYMKNQVGGGGSGSSGGGMGGLMSLASKFLK